MSLISIIVPVYNVEGYVEKCVESLLGQTLTSFEIILINDGSADASGEICGRLSKLHPDKIKLIEQENKGVSAARNAGLEIATGEYIMFVDPDDYCEPAYVEKLYKAISESDSEMAECAYYIDHTADRTEAVRLPFETDRISDVWGALFYEKQTGRKDKLPAFLWLGIFKNGIIQSQNIRFNTNVKYGEDFLFFAEYSLYCNSIALVNEPLYHSVHREGSSASRLKFSVEHALKTVYLTDEFTRLMNTRSWEGKEEYIAKRYVSFIPHSAILITRTKDSLKNKRKQLSSLIELSDIESKIRAHTLVSPSVMDKVYRALTIKRKINLLLIYGKAYNLLRNLKRAIQKKTV